MISRLEVRPGAASNHLPGTLGAPHRALHSSRPDRHDGAAGGAEACRDLKQAGRRREPRRGNALIAADAAAKSQPDGRSLLAITLTHAVRVSLFPSAPYHLMRDFMPVSVLGSLPRMVVVNAADPARNLADLVAQARIRVLNGGTSGNGSPPHLGLELFRRASGAGPLPRLHAGRGAALGPPGARRRHPARLISRSGAAPPVP